MKNRIFTIFTLIFSTVGSMAQLTVNTAVTANQLAQSIAGNGVSVSNVTLNCPTGAYALFTAGGTNLGMPNGVLLTSGQASIAIGPNFSGSAGSGNGGPGDPQLTAVAGFNTFDACILQFDFIPASNTINFNYVFGSDEYPEFVNSINDVFAFFVSGPNPGGGNYVSQNIALIPNTSDPVTINSVNGNVNSQYYVDNSGGATLQYDGLTTVLTATCSVVPCSTYTLKMAVADAVDNIYDSGVFLQENSLTSGGTLSAVVPNALVTPQFCNTPGQATVVATGGIPSSYTYSWNTVPPQTTQTATGLVAGTYQVTVTSFDCVNTTSTTATVVVPQTNPLTASTNVTNVTCNGLNNGQATIVPQNGAGPYTVTWTPNVSTGLTATGLAPNTYNISLTDSNGCTTTTSAVITQPAPLTSTISANDVLCNGGSTGSATVNPNGGTAQYSYSWSPSGQTGQTANGLPADTYTVTVTDANNCTTTNTVTVNNPPLLTATVFNSQNVSCFGGNNGLATINGSGGTGNLSYSWSPSGGNNATATGLAANTYTVTVTDQNNCSTTANVLITEPAQLTVAITNQQNVLCNGGNTGSATASGAGGTGTIGYSWSPSGGTNPQAQNLAANTYTVTVTDQNNCTATATVNITQPSALNVTANAVNASCNGSSTGSASASGNGGTGNLSYSWSNNQSGPNINNVAAGPYTVTVTDQNQCTATASVNIGQPTILTASITNITDVSCFGGSNGAATVTAGGGPGGYTYIWNPGGQNGATASNLTAGTYTVTVSDFGNCDTIVLTAVVNQGAPLNVVATVQTPTICNGQSTGITATGASNYAWIPSTGLSSTTGSSITAAPGGTTTYIVTGSTAAGCQGFDTVTVTVNPKPIASISANSALCAGNALPMSGSGSSVSAPATIASYSWDFDGNGTYEVVNGAADQSNVYGNPGNTSINMIVTTNQGCTDTVTFNLTVNPKPVADFSTNLFCQLTPSVFMSTSTVSSGSVSSYDWDFGDGGGSIQSNTSHFYQTGGTYDVTLIVGTPQGCGDTIVKTITILDNPVFAITTDIQCFNNVIFSANTTSGNVNNWEWDFGDGTDSQTMENNHTYTSIGNYTVTLTGTDANGCPSTQTTNVEIKENVSLDDFTLPNIITPNGDGLNEELILSGSFSDCSDYTISIYNRWGTKVYEFSKGQTSFAGKSTSGSKLQAGVYFYVITSGKLKKQGNITIAGV